MTLGPVRASCSFVLGIVMLVISAHSKGDAREELSDPIRFTDLEGAKIDAKFVSEQVVQRGGLESPVTVEEDWSIRIEVRGKIAWDYRPTSHTVTGPRTGRTNSFRASVGVAWDTGTGQAIWQFSDGKLTFIRSYESGAFRTVFAFAYDGNNLTCGASKSIFREQGKTETRVNSIITGDPITILDWKLVSSNCRLTR